MYTGDHAPRIFFGKYITETAICGETHPRNHPSRITCNYVISTYIICASIHACVCVSVCACMHMCMCLHVSIMCSAGPEEAVLDWYGPEADPVYWRRGREGVAVAGL